VCLDLFDGRAVHKTACFHFFHLDCLTHSAEYFAGVAKEKLNDGRPSFLPKQKAQEDYIVCPVCRAGLAAEDLEAMRQFKQSGNLKTSEASSSSSHHHEPIFKLPPEIKSMRREMEKLFAEQTRKGGIISIEDERKRLVVDSSTLISVVHTPQIPFNASF